MVSICNKIMCLNIIFLPLLSSVCVGFFGKLLGRKFSVYLSVLCIFLAFSLTLFLFYFSHQGFIYKIELFDWIKTSTVFIKWEFLFDGLTTIMLIVVLGVSLVVHIYSAGYMEHDPGLIRFMSYLSLFTFFMLMLITGNNFLQLFLGWEGVGICSYLLVSFWYTRLEALKSALKAVMVNKVGDFFFLLAILLIYYSFNSISYGVVFSLLSIYKLNFFYILNYKIHLISFISFLLFLGAVGKSAQIGLHTWLPDAMEGPTPVSALIHAATMVTAGIFLIIRSSFLFEYSPNILKLLIIFGGLTAFLGASIALVQVDIKKIIAYSTCSQLGYMMLACGFSGYSLALYHLANHAFFKALLFLTAGLIIHSIFDEQDLRKISIHGNYIFPKIFLFFLSIGSLSIIGFPGFSGFFSKDKILELAYSNSSFLGFLGFFLGTLTVFLTSFYSFKLFYLVYFMGNLNKDYANYNLSQFKKINYHSSNYLIYPLFLLVFGSVFSGYLFEDLIIGSGSPYLIKSILDLRYNLLYINLEYIPIGIKIFPTIISFCGMLFSYYFSFVIWRKTLYTIYNFKFFFNIIIFFLKKWNFDIIYNHFLVKPVLNYSYSNIYVIVEKGFLEVFGPLKIQSILYNFSKKLQLIFQSGYIYLYSFIYIQIMNILSCFIIWKFSFIEYIYLIIFNLF